MNGWTACGRYNNKDAIYRIEESPEGFYLFVFTDNMSILARDELQDTLLIAKDSAVADLGACNRWNEEVWEKSYSRPKR